MIIKQFWEFPEYQILDGDGYKVTVKLNGGTIECTDLNSGYWQYLFGYRHPEFLTVLKDPDSHRPPSTFTTLHDEAKELNTILTRETGYPHVLFLTSGSGAVDAALRMADRIHPGKKIVSLRNAFHGSNASALTASGFDFLHVTSFVREERFAQVEMTQKGFHKIEEYTEDEQLGCVILEPVQGVGGCEVVPEWFLRELFDLREKNDFLIVADEISTFARNGTLLTSQNIETQRPPQDDRLFADIICLGKGISGGYFPVSLVLLTDEVIERHERVGEFYYGNTLAGTRLGCRLVKTTIRLLCEFGFERIRSLGESIERSAKENSIPLRGMKGIMRSIDLGTAARAKIVSYELLSRHQFFTIPEGRYLMLMPSLTLPDDEIQRFFKTLKSFV